MLLVRTDTPGVCIDLVTSFVSQVSQGDVVEKMPKIQGKILRHGDVGIESRLA